MVAVKRCDSLRFIARCQVFSFEIHHISDLGFDLLPRAFSMSSTNLMLDGAGAISASCQFFNFKRAFIQKAINEARKIEQSARRNNFVLGNHSFPGKRSKRTRQLFDPDNHRRSMNTSYSKAGTSIQTSPSSRDSSIGSEPCSVVTTARSSSTIASRPPSAQKANRTGPQWFTMSCNKCQKAIDSTVFVCSCKCMFCEGKAMNLTVPSCEKIRSVMLLLSILSLNHVKLVICYVHLYRSLASSDFSYLCSPFLLCNENRLHVQPFPIQRDLPPMRISTHCR